MHEGIIIQSFLEKDIEQLNFYSERELKSLTDICNKLEESSESYQSSNTDLFLDDVGKFKLNNEIINNKRLKYVNILNRVIAQYNMLSNETNQRFNGDI